MGSSGYLWCGNPKGPVSSSGYQVAVGIFGVGCKHSRENQWVLFLAVGTNG